MLNFHDMEIRFGAAAAYHCLAEIEKAAKIPAWTVDGIDPETRLMNAIHAQDQHMNSQMAQAA